MSETTGCRRTTGDTAYANCRHARPPTPTAPASTVASFPAIGLDRPEPLLVRPNDAARMIGYGRTKFFELLKGGGDQGDPERACDPDPGRRASTLGRRPEGAVGLSSAPFCGLLRIFGARLLGQADALRSSGCGNRNL